MKKVWTQITWEMTDGEVTESKHLGRPCNLWIYCENFQKIIDSYCVPVHRPWKITVKFTHARTHTPPHCLTRVT